MNLKRPAETDDCYHCGEGNVSYNCPIKAKVIAKRRMRFGSAQHSVNTENTNVEKGGEGIPGF